MSISKLGLAMSLVAALSVSPAVDAQAAPDFTLKSQNDVNLRLAEQRGDIILLNFWASWCGPCLQEMPKLDKLAQKYQGMGVQIWGVNVESDSAAAKAYLEKVRVNFPILFDVTNDVSAAYSVQAMPTTVILNKDGEIASVHRGYQSGYEQKYENDIKKLLRE